MKLPYDEWNDELSGARPKTNWPLALLGWVAFVGFCGYLLWRR